MQYSFTQYLLVTNHFNHIECYLSLQLRDAKPYQVVVVTGIELGGNGKFHFILPVVNP